MKPVYQSIISDGEGQIGDCFRACVASLLGVDLVDVPHFLEQAVAESGDMGVIARKWLKEHHSLGLMTVHLPKENEHRIAFQGTAGVLCIVAIPSPNIVGGCHAVIGKISQSELSVQFVFDPRKGGKPCANKKGYFKKEPYYLQFLVPMNNTQIEPTSGQG